MSYVDIFVTSPLRSSIHHLICYAVDAATAEHDPLLRIAFISAFAMSNYSSTIGRIAKPFNPMLGETFEYVRLDKEYRYFSEQVSHHPPISACYAGKYSLPGNG